MRQLKRAAHAQLESHNVEEKRSLLCGRRSRGRCGEIAAAWNSAAAASCLPGGE
jgi:hypothetical protein